MTVAKHAEHAECQNMLLDPCISSDISLPQLAKTQCAEDNECTVGSELGGPVHLRMALSQSRLTKAGDQHVAILLS